MVLMLIDSDYSVLHTGISKGLNDFNNLFKKTTGQFEISDFITTFYKIFIASWTGDMGEKGETGSPGLPAKLSSLLDPDVDPFESKLQKTSYENQNSTRIQTICRLFRPLYPTPWYK